MRAIFTPTGGAQRATKRVVSPLGIPSYDTRPNERLTDRVTHRMRVIPVLDLMQGRVVRGVGGRRHEYQPVRSRLSETSGPLDVAQGLRREFGANELYLADLDAIQAERPPSNAIAQLAAARFDLLVDPGLRDVADGRALIASGVRRVVAALETSHGPEQLAAFVKCIGSESLVFSLDMKLGRPLGDPPRWSGDDPFSIAVQAVDCGVNCLILLDLASVGEGNGVPTSDLCRRLRKRFPSLELITGGGVRNRDDLMRLADSGVDAALVASALHDGRLTRDDLHGL